MLPKAIAIPAISLCALLGAASLPHSAYAAATGVIGKYDKDGDHTLDLDEVKAAASAHFDKLDKDSDGTLDKAELKGVMGPKAFKTADPDNDGKLDKNEYLAYVEKVFNKADVDHDGTLDARELKGAHTLKRLMG